MPNPFPENRNVLGGQQQTSSPVVAPVRPAPAPVTRRPVVNPVTPPSWATVVLPQPVPGPWNEVTEPHPMPSPWGAVTATQPGRRPELPQPAPTRRRPGQTPSRPPARTQSPTPIRKPTPTPVAAAPVSARRSSSGFVRGVLVSAAVLLAAVWGATLAFPSLLQYAIIADIAQLAENIFYTLWGVLNAIGIFALLAYAQRDAIISFVGANPLMSTSVGVGGLLCLILLGLTVKGMRRRQ